MLYHKSYMGAVGESRYDRRSASPRGHDRVTRNRSMSPNGRDTRDTRDARDVDAR